MDLPLKVRLHDILRDKAKLKTAGGQKGRFEMIMPSGVAVVEMLSILALPKDQVGLIIVNGRQVDFDYELDADDEIELFSPMAGD